MIANIVHARNPFNPWRDRDLYAVESPLTITDWIERRQVVFDLPTICVVNGAPVLRAEWSRRVIVADDVVVFAALPQGGGDGSNPLAIVAMIAVSVFAPGIAGALAKTLSIAEGTLGFALLKGAVAFAGMALVNALIPAPKPNAPQTMREIAAPSPTYTMQAQGNQARLGSPIPAIYGTHLIYPDFAARPYAEFVANEQYLYQLFVIGQGYYTIDEIRIEDTPIAVFDNVTYEIVAPGGNVTLFPTNVASSGEVVGQDCATGVTVGPFVANPSGTLCNYLAIDVAMPRGLFYAQDDGSISGKSITWTVETQPIDSSGTPTGGWTTLGTETYSAATNTAQRASYRYGVTAGRYQVRLTRTDTKDESSRAGHDLAWFGLRAYLTGGQAYGNVTLLAMRMQASNQLSGVSSRKINVTVTRKLPIWSSGGGWSAPTETQSIAWALADICRAEYGAELADARLDLDQLEALDAVWTTRGDKFNAVYDSRVSFWDALASCARAGRAAPVLQGGVIHFVRDALQTLPVALFTMRNIVRGSMRIEYVLHTDQTTDAAEAEYFDETTWSPKTVQAVLPSGTSNRPAKLRGLFGVTNRAQAWREAMYAAAQNRYRRKIITFQTELEGFIPTFGDLIAIAHDMPAWGQSAEVTAFLTSDNALSNSEVFGSWSGTAAVAADGVGPNGITAAATVTDSNAADWQWRNSNTAVAVSGSTWCASIYVKRDAVSKTTRFPVFRLLSNILNTYVDAALDTSTGECTLALQTGTGWSGVGVACESIADDWFRVSIHGTLTNAALTHMSLIFYPSVGAGASMNSGAYLASTQGSITVWGAQLEQSDTPGTYVPTTSAGRADVYVLTLSEPLSWEISGTHYVALRKRDGGVDGPISVKAGALANQVALDADPTELIYSDLDAERTHVAFGRGEFYRQRALVTAVRARGDLVEISCVSEDDTVHAVDGGSVPTEESWDLPTIPTVPQIPYDAGNPNSYLSVITGGTLENPTVTLSWSAAAGAERYVIEQSFDNVTWTRVGDTTQTRFSFTTVPGAQHLRVAPIGAVIGDWIVWHGTVAGAPQLVEPVLSSIVIATAAGTSIIIDWSPHLQPNIEFIEILRNVVNDSTTASVIGTVLGNVQTFVDTVSASGLTYYYWIRLVNSKGLRSGTGIAVSATSTAIGGIEVVGSLPVDDLTEGRVVYLTTNKKIYRYDGTSWTAAADGADLLANSVTSNKISVANLAAISADLGAVTAGSLNINSRFVVDAAGNVTISNAASGARLEVRNNVIKVYDAGGVLRVKLGDLTA